MTHEPADVAVEPLRTWLNTDHRHCGLAERLEIIERVIDYWVPVSIERGDRIEALAERVAALEAPPIPDGYSCVAALAERMEILEERLAEVRRLLS